MSDRESGSLGSFSRHEVLVHFSHGFVFSLVADYIDNDDASSSPKGPDFTPHGFHEKRREQNQNSMNGNQKYENEFDDFIFRVEMRNDSEQPLHSRPDQQLGQDKERPPMIDGGTGISIAKVDEQKTDATSHENADIQHQKSAGWDNERDQQRFPVRNPAILLALTVGDNLWMKPLIA